MALRGFSPIPAYGKTNSSPPSMISRGLAFFKAASAVSMSLLSEIEGKIAAPTLEE